MIILFSNYLGYVHHPSSIIHHPLSIIHHPSSTIHHLSSIIHHPSGIVPYQAFTTLDGQVLIAACNDSQFKQLTSYIQLPLLASDSKYISNANRVKHREELLRLLQLKIQTLNSSDLITNLNRLGVACGPINSIADVFKDPHIQSLHLIETLVHPTAGPLQFLRHPVTFSVTKPTLSRPPPLLGEHTREVLKERGVSKEEIESLFQSHVIA